MRCYACDAQHPSHYDGDTSRYYCHTCMEIINDTTFAGDLMKRTDKVDIETEELNGSDPFELFSLWAQGMPDGI